MYNIFNFIIQSIFIIGFTIIIIFLLRHNASSKFEERIGKYSIKNSKGKFDKSYYDIVFDGYYSFVKLQRKRTGVWFWIDRQNAF